MTLLSKELQGADILEWAGITQLKPSCEMNPGKATTVCGAVLHAQPAAWQGLRGSHPHTP